MTTDKELLPCPFCGSSATTWVDAPKENRVICTNQDDNKPDYCGTSSPDFIEMERAIEWWNTRAQSDTAGIIKGLRMAAEICDKRGDYSAALEIQEEIDKLEKGNSK